MIPTMDNIIADLAAGRMDKDTAALFIQQHLQNIVDATGQRQYFIGEALNGLLSGNSLHGPLGLTNEYLADRACDIADAVIVKLNAKG